MPQSPFRQDILNGKVALITGGGTGICHGIAHSLGKHGAKLMLMGRREEVLKDACVAFAKQGIEASFVAGDVRDFSQAEKAVAATAAQYGKLDILLNGAAGNFLCPTEKLSSNGFKTVIDIDLLGTFNMSRAAFTQLKATNDSLILNISATLHYQGTIMQSHVMAAKAGIDALAKNLACEWGEYGIRVCTIAPGAIGDTEGMRRLAPMGADKKIASEVPLRRLGTIEDIAHAAVFLASGAASYITGEILVVDGGAWLVKPAFVDRATWEKLAAKS
ncbi:MAG: SDR family oxidoreductase [Deltaproteobacteria bacterium]|nr:SDR family oxidoreductase [Deltaproteobacteria bacterium]